jgi:hypothetical protein
MGSVQDRIIEKLAEAMSSDPTARDFELYEHVDLEAVEQVLTHGESDATVRFTVDGYRVRVTADGSVTVDEAPLQSPDE